MRQLLLAHSYLLSVANSIADCAAADCSILLLLPFFSKVNVQLE
jgi:hypothetical protein